MTYLQKNNRNKKKKFTNLILLIAIVLIIIELTLHPLKLILASVSKPLDNIRHGIALSFEGFGAFLTSKPKLEQENDLLQEEINKLRLEVERASLYQQENSSLRALLDIRDQSPNKIVAQVIAHPPATAYDTLLVRLGDWKSSVFIEMPVFYGGVYIGYIEEISNDTALIRLVTSDTLTQEVYVGDKTILLSGKGGGTFEVTVPKGFEISVGQTISHVRYPTQPFAVVEHIETDDIQAVQKVFLRSAFSLHSIRYVNF